MVMQLIPQDPSINQLPFKSGRVIKNNCSKKESLPPWKQGDFPLEGCRYQGSWEEWWHLYKTEPVLSSFQKDISDKERGKVLYPVEALILAANVIPNCGIESENWIIRWCIPGDCLHGFYHIARIGAVHFLSVPRQLIMLKQNSVIPPMFW